jgi:hypothetical protein
VRRRPLPRASLADGGAGRRLTISTNRNVFQSVRQAAGRCSEPASARQILRIAIFHTPCVDCHHRAGKCKSQDRRSCRSLRTPKYCTGRYWVTAENPNIAEAEATMSSAVCSSCIHGVQSRRTADRCNRRVGTRNKCGCRPDSRRLDRNPQALTACRCWAVLRGRRAGSVPPMVRHPS